MADLQNFFTFSNKANNLLFKGLSVSSNEAMVGLCFGVALFTFLYEAVKSLRHYMVILQLKKKHNPKYEEDIKVRKDGSLVDTAGDFHMKRSERLRFHCLQSLLYMLQLTMGYMIMLIVMSFNAWFVLSIVLTTALCYYFHEYILSRKSLIMPLEIPGSNL